MFLQGQLENHIIRVFRTLGFCLLSYVLLCSFNFPHQPVLDGPAV